MNVSIIDCSIFRMQPKKKRKTEVESEEIRNYTSDDYITQQLYELVEENVYSHNTKAVNDCLSRIKTLLISLKPGKKQNLKEAVSLAKCKKSKWPLLPSFVMPNGTFQFVPPSELYLCGSMVSGISISKDSHADILMVIPGRVFEKKDYINARYVVKRTLYLHHIIPKIKSLDFVHFIRYSFYNNDPLKPILCLKTNLELDINIIPVIKKGVLASAALSTDRNNLRPSKIFDDDSIEESPTPFYNYSVTSDFLNEELSAFEETIRSHENLRKVIIITKLWIKQAGYSVSLGRKTLLEIFHYLLKENVINLHMNLITLLKQVLLFFSTDFVGSDLCWGNGGDILYNVKPWVKKELSVLSSHLITMINKEEYNMLISSLMKKLSGGFDVYDLIYDLAVPEDFSKEHTLQYCGIKFLGFIDNVTQTLKLALGDRVSHIGVRHNLIQEWSRMKDLVAPQFIRLGLNVNKDTWTRHVDKGPVGDSPVAAEFKAFWGDKVSLRRFQDSSILYSVVWDGKTVKERRSIVTQIIRHILKLHLNVTNTMLVECKLDSTEIVGQKYYLGDGEEQAQKIINTFMELSRTLRNCSKIPLPITSVQPISPVLRNTELYPQREYQVNHKVRGQEFPSYGKPCPDYNAVHELVCHFQLSGKWPEDVRGIIRLKTSFYLALKEELQCKHIASKVSTDFMDIVRNGFVFRLRFYVPKEAKLRSTNISFWTPSTADELKITTEILPYTISLLTSFSMLHSAFPLTVRYMKFWVHSNNLSFYIPDIFIELIVAHVFANAEETFPIQTATTGFFRTISFLASFDWRLYPVLINLNGELSTETFELYNRFMNTRKVFPDACIATPKNEFSQLTKQSPNRASLKILRVLSSETLRTLESDDAMKKPQKIFNCNSAAYNIKIHIRPSQTGFHGTDMPQEHHAKSTCFPVVDYHPVALFVKEVVSAYGNIAWFFYNKYNPLCVGVVLKKSKNCPGKFTVNNSSFKVPVEAGLVQDNLDAMLSDFDIMGKGLIKSIEVVNLDI